MFGENFDFIDSQIEEEEQRILQQVLELSQKEYQNNVESSFAEKERLLKQKEEELLKKEKELENQTKKLTRQKTELENFSRPKPVTNIEAPIVTQDLPPPTMASRVPTASKADVVPVVATAVTATAVTATAAAVGSKKKKPKVEPPKEVSETASISQPTTVSEPQPDGKFLKI